MRKFVRAIAITSILSFVATAATISSSPVGAVTKTKSTHSHKAKGKNTATYCRLLTTAQLTVLMGLAPGTPKNGGDPGSPGCTWPAKSQTSDTNLNPIAVTVDVNTKAGSNFFQSGESCGPSVATSIVSGVGSKAYFCDIELSAQQGSVGITLSVHNANQVVPETLFVTDVQLMLKELRT